MDPDALGLGGLSAVLYTLAAVAHLAYMFRHEYGGLARWSTRTAWITQTLVLLLLIIRMQRVLIYNLFEFSHLLSWLLVTPYIAIEATRQNQAAGASLTPVIAFLTVISLALPSAPSGAPLPGHLVFWHVGVTVLGYLCFLVALAAGVLYLVQEQNLRQKRWGPIYYRLPSLEALDGWAERAVSVGFPLLTLGIGAGYGFAHETWERFWQFDPKVLLTFLVWLIYGGYLIMRRLFRWGGRRAAWWVVVGGAVLLVNYFAANLISSVHRFGL